MTLAEWADKQPYGVVYINSEGAGRATYMATASQAVIPDSQLIDRPAAFRLTDFLVSSVIAGSIWFTRRKV